MYDYWPCEVRDVHDGDTIKFRVDLGLDTGRDIWVRLRNVWSPELSAPRGIECRDGVITIAPQGSVWRLRTFKQGKTDKELLTFIRYVADVSSLDGLFSLNSWIVERGWGTATPVSGAG